MRPSTRATAPLPVAPPDAVEALPFVSVIVPVYREPRLADCLRALADQRYPADRFEVVVVENGRPEDSASILDRYPAVRRAHEPERGSYAARNRGVEVARGEVLAFTDADCLPDPGWLCAGVACLRADPRVDIVGGDVHVFADEPGRSTPAELWECAWGFPQQDFVENKHFAATANLILRRETVQEVGPFDTAVMSGGDMQWGQRARAAGKTMAFSYAARVGHPARKSLGALARKYVRTCGGRFQLRLRTGEGHRATVRKLLRKPFLAAARSDLGYSAADRVRYVGVETALSAVQLLEIARLCLGGRPRRR